jgi:hypothetical protein
MRLVHCRVAVQPRAGHEPIDEALEHSGDVVDVAEAAVPQRGLVGLHRTPRRRGPTRRSPPHRRMRRDPLRYGPDAFKSGERCWWGQPVVEVVLDETCRTSARTAIWERTVGISPVAWRFADSEKGPMSLRPLRDGPHPLQRDAIIRVCRAHPLSGQPTTAESTRPALSDDEPSPMPLEERACRPPTRRPEPAPRVGGGRWSRPPPPWC